MKTKYKEGSNFPYHIRVGSPAAGDHEMYDWCKETFGKSWTLDINGVWMILWDGYAFKYEADRNWFVLRWS